MRLRTSLAAAAVLTLALGALACLLTVADGVRTGRLPFRDPDRLVMLEGVFRDQGQEQPFPISQTDFADWRRRTTAFAPMSVYGNLGFNLERGMQSLRVSGELVNAAYFDLLGVEPVYGRFFRAAEDSRPLTDFVVVLGHDLWRRAFAADPAVVGRALRMNGRAYTVVGIAPRGFRGLTDQAELWVPSMLPPISDYLTVRRERWVAAAARLAPGVTLRRAQAQMDAVTGELARAYPNMDQGMGVRVTPLAR